MATVILNALWGIFFFMVAAAFKAVADTLQHHFDTSIFKNKRREFWDPLTSDDYVKLLPFTKYRLDAWHLANSAMIVCIISAFISYKPLTQGLFAGKIYWLWVLTEFAVFGALWNVTFNTFYNKILIAKKNGRF